MPALLEGLAAWVSGRGLVLLGMATALVVVGYSSFYVLDQYQVFSMNEDSTVAALRRAVHNNPTDLSSRVQLAAAYMDKEDLDAAKAELEEILKAKPDLTLAQTALGMAYFRQGQRGAALDLFEKVVRALEGQKYANFSADLNNAYYYSGLIQMQEGRYQEAESRLRKALVTNNADADAHMYLGWTLCQLGRCEEAIPELNVAIQFLPDEAEPHFYRGLVLEKLGRKDMAASELELALKYRAGYQEAAEALRRVKTGQP